MAGASAFARQRPIRCGPRTAGANVARMIKSVAKPKIRFAFTIAEGPNAGLTSGSWRVWVSKEDTYIAAAEIGGMWKCSLHGDDAWQWAITQEEAASDDPVWVGADRAPWKYKPPPFLNGHRLAFVICTFRHALLPRDIDPHDVHIRVEDRWDQVTLACIRMTEPGFTVSDDRIIGGPLALASGRQVWVTAKTEPLPGGEPEPQAISSMLEPAIPGAHDVAAPGVFHRGVHVA